MRKDHKHEETKQTRRYNEDKQIIPETSMYPRSSKIKADMTREFSDKRSLVIQTQAV